jgi:hypothetical protein
MVAFFIPAITLAFAVVAIRRRRRREHMAAALAKERELSRSKDQLIANLSHELRTPLTGIYTSALAIEEIGYSDPDVALELNGMIVDQSAELNRMVEDLLVSAQADAGRLTFDIVPGSALHEIEGVAKELARLGTPITVRARDAAVLADTGRLRQRCDLVERHPAAARTSRPRPPARAPRDPSQDDGPGVRRRSSSPFEPFVHQGTGPHRSAASGSASPSPRSSPTA